MKRILLRSLLISALVLIMTFTAACAEDVTLDTPVLMLNPETCTVIWNPVPGAYGYDIGISPTDSVEDADGLLFTSDTMIQVPADSFVFVRARDEAGLVVSDWAMYDIRAALDVVFGNTAPTDNASAEAGSAEEAPADSEWLKVDETGLATWYFPGAVRYEFRILSPDMDYLHSGITTATSLQLPEGCRLDVLAIEADGTITRGLSSDFFGGPRPAALRFYHDAMPGLEEKLTKWELISNIDRNSFVANADGTVSFTAAGPEGTPVRFWGRGVSLAENGLVFEPVSLIQALDSVGSIYTMKPVFDDPGDNFNWFTASGCYTLDSRTSVDSVDELYAGPNFSNGTHDAGAEAFLIDFSFSQPNFPGFGTICLYNDYSSNPDSFTLTKLTISLDPAVKTTGLRSVVLNEDSYRPYLPGDRYIAERETNINPATMLPGLDLYFIPDIQNDPYGLTPEMMKGNYFFLSYRMNSTIVDRHTIGDLKDANGTVVDKATAVMAPGMTLEITIGDYTFDMPVPVVEQHTTANVMHDLVPDLYPEATGTINTLVIPIVWTDGPEAACEENLARIRLEVGRVLNPDGTVTDYSGDPAADGYSLSQYYDIASYGKLSVNSYITAWYPAPYAFTDIRDMQPDAMFIDEVSNWLYSTYPDMDWSLFDKDGNGNIDSVVFVNFGENTLGYYNMLSFTGGLMSSRSYTNDKALIPGQPVINIYINLHQDFLTEDTLIHEFGHNLGLVDYYDVNYSGIDAVGSYDMQSASVGDWNPYSKFAAGWIEPTVITGLEPGESIDVTIGAFATTGNAIVIPAADSEFNGSPFNEYVMIDLFTPEGINAVTAKDFGLGKAAGVRIYHVDARMERYEVTSNLFSNKRWTIGAIHYGNDSTQDNYGYYLLELIQAGGRNTFTTNNANQLRTQLKAEDLFTAGKTFDASKSVFFFDGKMDDSTEFGYIVKVVSIKKDENGTQQAVIRITRK